RIAPGLSLEGADQLGIGVVAEMQAREVADLFAAEPLERPALERGEPEEAFHCSRVLACTAGLVLATSDHDRNRESVDRLPDRLEEQNRLGIGVVQVVEEERKRLLLGALGEKGIRGFEEPRAD